MTDLVTGGAGFIGSRLVERLLRGGGAVRVLDLDADARLPDGAERVVGSAADRETLRRAMAGARRVFHVAGNPRLWARRPADFLAANLHTTEAVLDEASRSGVARVVVVSTAAIHFAPRRGGAAPGLADMPGGYTRSKFLAERAALDAAAKGLPVAIVNPCLPMGAGDRNLTPPTRMLLDFVNGATPAFLDFELRIVDVGDLAEGCIRAAERGPPGERYFLGGPPLRLSELLAMAERITRLEMPRRQVPYALAFAAAACSGLAARIAGREPRAPLEGVRLARRPPSPGALRTAADLGLALRPVEQTLAEALAWLADEGLAKRRFSVVPPAR
ncbi:MAG: NAD-dependent epimerase/dehydratase family protein [Defluviicoccus sp.]|nr:NAD-dependent epimerase/dehydratase family protein [Defluviicoccus sp.]MDE0382432.1 NAD-dependent epimerase/dehydratase family protein [Defluviicoccus sp.]